MVINLSLPYALEISLTYINSTNDDKENITKLRRLFD